MRRGLRRQPHDRHQAGNSYPPSSEGIFYLRHAGTSTIHRWIEAQSGEQLYGLRVQATNRWKSSAGEAAGMSCAASYSRWTCRIDKTTGWNTTVRRSGAGSQGHGFPHDRQSHDGRLGW